MYSNFKTINNHFFKSRDCQGRGTARAAQAGDETIWTNGSREHSASMTRVLRRGEIAGSSHYSSRLTQLSYTDNVYRQFAVAADNTSCVDYRFKHISYVIFRGVISERCFSRTVIRLRTHRDQVIDCNYCFTWACCGPSVYSRYYVHRATVS